MQTPDFFVAVTGNDDNDGTRARPFATLERARDEVRKAKDRVADRDIHVEIAGGLYPLRETVVFGLADSAMPDRKIVYAAADGEVPVFSAGLPVTDWVAVPADETPSEAPEAARGKLWRAAFPGQLTNVLSVFDGETRLQRAKADPFGLDVKIDIQRTQAPEFPLRELRFPAGALKEYSNLDSVELTIIPMHPWTMCILGLESVDTERGVAIVDNDPVYPLGKTHHGLVDQVWAENVFEALDGPGKWVSENSDRRIYLWPKGEHPGDGIVVPALKELLRIEGEISYDGPVDKPVTGIEFKGLTFTHGMRDTWDQGYAGTGLQHNWDFFDRGNAMVRFRGAEDCALENCRVVNSASGGVRFDLHCRGNRVAGCEIGYIGGTGVLLQGYGPGTKDVNHGNVIIDNHIHHNGEDWWHTLGIFVWQSSGNRIAHNTIHHAGYSGICVTGRIIFDREGKKEASKSVRWNEITVETDFEDTPEKVTQWWYRMEPYLHARENIIEKNEIYRVMERLGDGNGIYISGCGKGNIVRLNYIHDIFGTGSNAVIRTDDHQYETLIEQNLLFRCGGSGVYLKHKNDLVNNVLVDLGVEDPLAVHAAKPAFDGYIGLRRAPIHGSRVQRNIIYSTKGDVTILNEGPAGRQSWGSSYLRECAADANIYFSPENSGWATEYLAARRAEGVEKNSVQADPKMTRPGLPDFTVADDSPALALGFVPFDLSDVGAR